MKILKSIFMAISLLAAGSIAAQSECGVYGGLSEDVCHVSLIRLIANPEKYDGKLVKVVAVLENLDGTFFRIYHSTEAMKVQISEGAIVIEENIRERLSTMKVDNGDWISVAGRFSVKTNDEFQGQHIGSLREIFLMAPGN